MVDNRGSAPILAVIGIIRGVWRLVMTILIAGISLHVQALARHIIPGAMRKRISIVGVAMGPGKPLVGGFRIH